MVYFLTVPLLDDFETDMGMFFFKFCKECRNNHGCGENRNRHRHVLCFFGVFQLFLRMLKFAHNPVCMAEKDFPVLGEDDVSSGSAKQGDAQLLFQHFNSVGQRRLGNVKRFRRVGQMLELCGLLEIGQCKKREFHKSLLGIIYNLLLIYKLYALLYKCPIAHGILLSKVMNIS